MARNQWLAMGEGEGLLASRDHALGFMVLQLPASAGNGMMRGLTQVCQR
jgi:hypothetical protein